MTENWHLIIIVGIISVDGETLQDNQHQAQARYEIFTFIRQYKAFVHTALLLVLASTFKMMPVVTIFCFKYSILTPNSVTYSCTAADFQNFCLKT